MTAVKDQERFRQPTVKRLGLDDGWWLFCPHFLNLGLPLVFVDACLLPGAGNLGFESFGARRPDAPLPAVDLRIEVFGDGVNLYDSGRQPHLLTGHWFGTLVLPRATRSSPEIGVIVGDSYAVQLSWSALWKCRIGTAKSIKIGVE